MARPYAIALYGATGFTGSLTAHWLADHTDLQVCIAGRNEAKLLALQQALSRPLPIEVCTHEDPESMENLAALTEVLLSTVGPYASYGIPVIEAAMKEGCHYLDITGEPAFVQQSRAQFDAIAKQKKLRIVHCCGFDSLPHDIGVYYTVKQLPADADLTVRAYISSRGGISGGTWNSALDAIASRERGPKVPPVSDHDAKIQARFHRSRVAHGWAVPLPTIDPVIVVRSARALRYGSSFRYGHYARIKTLRYLLGGALGVGAVVAAAQVPPLKRWLKKKLPSGAGPSREVREAGWLKIHFVGEGGGQTVHTVLTADRDPGYAMTSRWVGLSAILLADADLPERYGVLTPAVAMGDELIEKLPLTGTTITTV